MACIRQVQPGANAGFLGADPDGLETRGLNPSIGVLDDPLKDHIGNDQDQIGPSLREMRVDRVSI
jgi:hypothetical protein